MLNRINKNLNKGQKMKLKDTVTILSILSITILLSMATANSASKIETIKKSLTEKVQK